MHRKICIICGSSGDTLHMFPEPKKHIDRFNEWVAAVGGEMLGMDKDYIYRNRRICRKHFETKYHNRYGKLNHHAVPKLFLGDGAPPVHHLMDHDYLQVHLNPRPGGSSSDIPSSHFACSYQREFKVEPLDTYQPLVNLKNEEVFENYTEIEIDLQSDLDRTETFASSNVEAECIQPEEQETVHECFIFSKHLSSKLQKLNENTLTVVKNLIDNILCNADNGMYDSVPALAFDQCRAKLPFSAL